jgi:glycosyltransferase involved in cell wall biosynthesis
LHTKAITIGSFSFTTHHLPPAKARELVSLLGANRRFDLRVRPSTSMNLERLRKNRLLDPNLFAELKARALDFRKTLESEERAPRLLMINATESGGGVAEMRPDTEVLLKDLGLNAQWLVMDGVDPFFRVTAHIHEAIQNPKYRPLEDEDFETLQIVWIHNLERLLREGFLDETSVIWIDDPQPLGLIPLIKALRPEITTIWRCHVHSSHPAPSVGGYLSELLQGKLDPDRDHLLCEYLDFRNIRSLRPERLATNAAVFHRREFSEGLQLSPETSVFLMGPAINPLAYKNMTLSQPFISATLEKYGIKKRSEQPSPLVMEISRFDPYKGPIELIVAFVEMVKRLPDKELQKRVRLLFAGNKPGDNPLGENILKSTRSFVAALPISTLPNTLQGRHDIRSRIHILELSDISREDALLKILRKFTSLDAGLEITLHTELLELKNAPAEEALRGLSRVGFLEEDVIERIRASLELEILLECVQFTPEQIWALTQDMQAQNRTMRSQRRAREGLLTGKEMNHLEVNAFQSGACVRAQFSSKEGFGLVVSEAMMKSVEDSPGVMVATLVGGIGSQVKPELGLPVVYEEEDIEASLAMYNAVLPDQPATTYRKLYKAVIQRPSVQAFSEALEHALLMGDGDKAEMNGRAREFVLQNFSSHSNVWNILNILVETTAPSSQRA